MPENTAEQSYPYLHPVVVIGMAVLGTVLPPAAGLCIIGMLVGLLCRGLRVLKTPVQWLGRATFSAEQDSVFSAINWTALLLTIASMYWSVDYALAWFALMLAHWQAGRIPVWVRKPLSRR